jgi:hypothetical protein
MATVIAKDGAAPAPKAPQRRMPPPIANVAGNVAAGRNRRQSSAMAKQASVARPNGHQGRSASAEIQDPSREVGEPSASKIILTPPATTTAIQSTTAYAQFGGSLRVNTDAGGGIEACRRA